MTIQRRVLTLSLHLAPHVIITTLQETFYLHFNSNCCENCPLQVFLPLLATACVAAPQLITQNSKLPKLAATATPNAPAPYGVPLSAALAPVPIESVPVGPVASSPLSYFNLNFKMPTPLAPGQVTSDLVQRLPVKALGRPQISYTPQVTEVRPEIKFYENTFDVLVPRPVFNTQHVTPMHHMYMPKPYAVPQPYAVHQPYAVPAMQPIFAFLDD